MQKISLPGRRQSQRPFSRISLLLVAILLFSSTGVSQATSRGGFELRIATVAGAPTETAGINQIDVSFSFVFGAPIQDGDIERLKILANDINVSKLVNESGGWHYSRPDTLQLALPLEKLLQRGVSFQANGATIAFTCILTLRGGRRETAAAVYDFIEKEDVIATSQPEAKDAPTTATQPAAVTQAEPGQVKANQPQVTREVVAEATVTPDGGTLEAPGALRITIPKGALPRAEKITVKRLHGIYTDKQGALYEVERSSGEHRLNAPAEVEFILPPGVNGRNALLVEEIMPEVISLRPAPAAGKGGAIKTSVEHFSLEGLLIDVTGENITRLDYAKHDTVVAGSLVILADVGAKALAMSLTAGVSVKTFGISLVIGAGVGWFTGVEREMSSKLEGFKGPFKALGFDVYWEPQQFHGTPGIWADFNAAGELIRLSSMSAHDAKDKQSKPLINYDRAGQDKQVASWLFIPLPVLKTAAMLQGVQRWFSQAGFATRPDTIVRIHNNLGLDPTGIAYLGEWDRHTLNVQADTISVLHQKKYPKEILEPFLAVMVHEYWHALYAYEKQQEEPFIEPFPGAEEAMAVALESLAVTNWQAFADRLQWKDTAVRLISGLTLPGKDEDLTRRGYDFWPFAKFLFHRKGGASAFNSLARGKLVGTDLDLAFVNFVYSICTQKEALAHRESVPFANAGEVSTTEKSFTGWSKLSLHDFAQAGKLAYSAGRVQVAESRPLSLRLFFVKLPPSSLQAQLIVRRRLGRQDLNEKIFAFPPKKTFSEWKPTADRSKLLTGLHGLLISPKMLGGGTDMLYLPVGLIGLSSADTAEADDADPLFVYPLLPPVLRTAAIVLDPETEEEKLKLEWQEPLLGPSVDNEEALAGYRLYGKKVNVEKPILIAELLYSDAHWGSEKPTKWYTGESDKQFALEESSDTANLPEEIGRGYVQYGLASVEGILRDSGGPAMSEISWLGLQQGKILGKVLSPNMPGLRDDTPGPVPGLKNQQVRCSFVNAGAAEEKWVVTDEMGEFTLDVPLNVPVTCQHANNKSTVTCTEQANSQTLLLGGVKIKEISTGGDPELVIPAPPQ